MSRYRRRYDEDYAYRVRKEGRELALERRSDPNAHEGNEDIEAMAAYFARRRAREVEQLAKMSSEELYGGQP